MSFSPVWSSRSWPVLTQVHLVGWQASIWDVLSEGDLQPHKEEQLYHPLGNIAYLYFSGEKTRRSYVFAVRLMWFPTFSAARQPSCNLPHQEDAARWSHSEADHFWPAGRWVLYIRLRPVAPAHDMPHGATSVLYGPVCRRGTKPETPTHRH